MPQVYKPGFLQVIYGPMKSGKTESFVRIFDEVRYSSHKWKVFQPSVNTREAEVRSRISNISLPTTIIDENKPETILEHITEEDQLVGLDEAQFFDVSLYKVVDKLLSMNKHVVVSGLLLDFRAQPFGPMPWIVGRANHSIRLTAICEVDGCDRKATRTQRLINGKPASFNSPIVLIEGTGNEKYEPRCVYHHKVPLD